MAYLKKSTVSVLVLISVLSTSLAQYGSRDAIGGL